MLNLGAVSKLIYEVRLRLNIWGYWQLRVR